MTLSWPAPSSAPKGACKNFNEVQAQSEAHTSGAGCACLLCVHLSRGEAWAIPTTQTDSRAKLFAPSVAKSGVFTMLGFFYTWLFAVRSDLLQTAQESNDTDASAQVKADAVLYHACPPRLAIQPRPRRQVA